MKREVRICEALAEHPMTLRELAEHVDSTPRSLERPIQDLARLGEIQATQRRRGRGNGSGGGPKVWRLA